MADNKEDKSFADQAVSSPGTPSSEAPFSDQRAPVEPRTPGCSSSPFRSTSGNPPRSVRSGSSPFFGSSRSHYQAKWKSPRQEDSTTTSGIVPPTDTPETTTLLSRSSKQGRRFSPAAPSDRTSTRLSQKSSKNSPAPKRVIRPDTWWQNRNTQKPSASETATPSPPPSVPDQFPSRPPLLPVFQNPATQAPSASETAAPPPPPKQYPRRPIPPVVWRNLETQTPSASSTAASPLPERSPLRPLHPSVWQNPPPPVLERSPLRPLHPSVWENAPPPVPERSPLRLLARPAGQNAGSQTPSASETAAPPPLPERSPLRLLHRPSQQLVHQSTEAPVPETPSVDPRVTAYEDRALYAELSPPPLSLRKTRQPGSAPTTPGPPPPRDLGSSTAQERSHQLSRQPAVRRQARRPALRTYASVPADAVAPSPSPKVLADREKTLNILCSSPTPEEERLQELKYLEYLERRRAAYDMASLRPESAAAMTAHRREAVRLAQDQQRAVAENCKRSKLPEPDYDFDELTGRGSFGRVYKGRQRSTGKVVAIKVIDIDKADFKAHGDVRDEQIRDFNREIRILRQAQESGAENLNHIIEALTVHSQLWMVCEYCPGGSVKTLMRATNDRLAEKYIIVVARELAKALKGLHAAGILHRDVKAANVLVHQEGRLELCDFGVSTVLDTQTDKRKTFIGTLHWMPPELWTENPEYSDEVDVWEYGCTLYECAVGQPPNADLRERQQLKMRMRRLKQAITLPENQTFSDGLRSLVASTLSPDVASRPSMKDVLEHPYLKDTEETHPTSILAELVQTYYAWVMSGGQRISLFMPGGAAGASTFEPNEDVDDEWNFSMTQDFQRRVSAILEHSDFSGNETMEGEETPRGSISTAATSVVTPPKEMTAVERANFEARVQRGADLSNIFDPSKPAYDYKIKQDFIPIPEQRQISDLPFRAMAEDRPSSIASNVIDLGDFDESDYAVAATPRTDDKIQTAYAATPLKEETIRLADASTLREKRANSKGPRDPNNSSQSLTARRASSSHDVPRTTAAHDFAMSQEDWTVKNRAKAPELQEPAEITSSRPGHATMDWSFAAAMSEVAIPQINEPEPAVDDEPGPAAEDTTTDGALQQKSKKHATMDWSFTQAMAEASSSQAATEESPTINSSPPTAQQIPSSRPTPTRPAPLLRQMTMPVTMGDFAQAEEQEIPRPSTALSEAYSDISTASTDVDPFGLERDNDDGDDEYPGATTLDDDVGGLGGFYTGRGRTMFGGRSQRSSMASTPATAAGPGPEPYRDGFPGLSASAGRGAVGAQHGRNPSAVSGPVSAGGGGGVSEAGTAGGRLTVDVPPAFPPSSVAMSAAASFSEVEAELTRLLEEMQGTLNAASQVVGGLVVRRRKAGESEWEDEE
ncbi:Serine/threonine-protein kinase KIC1 [Exophiala dermatitidis]